MKPRGVALLGATGSIGRAALRVIARHADRFQVRALTAHTNAGELRRIAGETDAGFIGIVKEGKHAEPGWRTGVGSLIEAAALADVDIVLNGVVGAAGLDATLTALAAGKRVALANKESLVVGGTLVMDAARRGGGSIVPVDSEHSAILQCIAGNQGRSVRRIILTASGGPFRDWPTPQLEQATLAGALQHPTWRMGRKITVDSATLVNKALEVIEAHHLFGVPFDAIDVVVHPQSIVHSMVEFSDGSVIAQLGVPSMELPILYALTHPERIEDPAIPRFDPVACSPLVFEPVRHDAFPALELGISAGRKGGAAPAVFNAANEEAVALFLAGAIGFNDIGRAIGSALDALGDLPGGSREQLLAADAAARHHVSGNAVC
ncbi:MAG: 1-deoxy-D-xylulose-5-phosphate reductoisomerase [Gemmatimonadota bacterium]